MKRITFGAIIFLASDILLAITAIALIPSHIILPEPLNSVMFWVFAICLLIGFGFGIMIADKIPDEGRIF